jgi:hypothetical protein
MKKSYLILIVILMLSLNVNVFADNDRSNGNIISDSLPFLHFIKEKISGKCYSVIVKDTILYAGIGNKLVVYNVADKSNPQMINSIDLLAYSIKIKENYLFTVGNNISIVDISDLANPVISNTINDDCNDIIVSGNYLYTLKNTIRLYNIEDVNNPYFISQCYPSYEPKTFSKSKKCLYVMYDYSVSIIDVADSLNMHEVGTIIQDEYMVDLWSDSNYLYIAYVLSGNIIGIYDLSDEYNPQHLSDANIAGFWDIIRKIYVENNYLYYSSDEYEEYDITILNGHINIIDISDKLNPSMICNGFGSFMESSDLYAKDGFIYLADINSNNFSYRSPYGIKIINDTIPDNPNLTSSIDITDSLSDMAIIGDYLFINDNNVYYYLIDDLVNDNTYKKSNMNNPFDTETRTINYYIKKLFSNENFLCVSKYFFYDNMYDTSYTEEWIDIYQKGTTTPTTFYSKVDIPGTERYFFLKDEYIYILGCSNNGLHIVDIDSTNEVGFLPMNNYREICVYDNYAFILDYSGTLIIVDVNDKTNPYIIQNISIPNTPLKLFAYKNYLYIATSTGGVRIYSISNINDIYEVGYTENFGSNKNICVIGNYLYEADGNLHIFDVSDKSNPVLYANWQLDNSSFVLAVNNDYIFIGSLFMFGFENYTGIKLKNSKNKNTFDIKQTGDRIDIKYSINSDCRLKLSMFDIQGRKIRNLIDEYVNKGDYTARYSIKHLPKGVYFIKGQINNRDVNTKKIFKL